MPVRSDFLLAGVSVAVLASTSAKAAALSNSYAKDLSKPQPAETQISLTIADSLQAVSSVRSSLLKPEKIEYFRFTRTENSTNLPERPRSLESISATLAAEPTAPIDAPVVTPDSAFPTEADVFLTETNRPLAPLPAADPLAPPALEQITSVSQLSDVQPTDWAFQTLQSIGDRYDCFAGYGDEMFQGDRAVSRYEFAAGLSACLDAVFARLPSDTVSAEDLEVIRRLQAEFRPELAILRGRVDALEARAATLEAQAFSPSSTVLGGEVVFGLSDGFGGNPPGEGQTNPIFTYSTRLQLITSFTGKDRLRVELAAGNLGNGGFSNETALNSQNALLSFETDTDNQITLGQLEYRFAAFDDRVVFTIKPVGFSLSSILTSNSPYFSDSQGSISRFGQLSPLFRIGNLESGLGFDWLISRQLRFQFAYGSTYSPIFNNRGEVVGTGGGTSPRDGFLFGKAGFALGGQLLFAPSNNAQLGLAYIYGYSPDGRLNTFTGSRIADASGFINQPANIHALNLTFQWELSPKIIFAASGGAVVTYAARTNSGAVSTTFMASLGFRDPFGRQEGDLLGVIVGQPLILLNIAGFQGSTALITDGVASYHAELFYRFRINDYLSITPGFFLVTNPGNFEDNETIYIGALRTSIRF